MRQKKLLIYSLLMASFLMITIDAIQAQNNTIQNEILSKKTGKILINPNITLKPGGYSIEIENNSIFNKSQSALEVILAVPGVFMRDSITEVAGKRDMILQVNEFDLRLSALQIPDYLSAISGETIKEVEVIQYPSATYDSFTGSIINIITKKTSSTGTLGVVRTAIGNFNKFHESADLYIVNSKSNFTLSVADQYNKTFNTTETRSKVGTDRKST